MRRAQKILALRAGCPANRLNALDPKRFDDGAGHAGLFNAIRLDRTPQFDCDHLLWGERQIRSVTNMTRADARDFLQLAAEIKLKPKCTSFPLEKANEALQSIRNDAIDGVAMIVP